MIDLSSVRVDNPKPINPDEPPDVWGRNSIKQAQEALTLAQHDVVETVAGWDALAGNSRKLDVLRAGLDELFIVWL